MKSKELALKSKGSCFSPLIVTSKHMIHRQKL
jgi:hypothetical protein